MSLAQHFKEPGVYLVVVEHFPLTWNPKVKKTIVATHITPRRKRRRKK